MEAANIRQVVGEFVPLKKRGHNWVGLCPFHPDKDPSFSVNEDKQIFYCFGCGEGGSAIKFLMKMQGLSFPEAVKTLASRYGITVPERPLSPERRKKLQLRDELIEVNEKAAAFFHENLLSSRSAAEAREYLEERGMDSSIISTFRLGWAQDRWDALVNFLQEQGVNISLAETAGLVMPRKGGNGHYDRFRGRIIFPIRDMQGNTVAFGARILPGKDQDDQPKYINSPETPVYSKGKVLYGLYQNKSAIRKAGFGVIVEGYMDLLALVQAGVGNAAATLGTALTADHVKFLKRVCRDWVVVFDGDAAGQRAAARALPLFYAQGLNVRVLSLPVEDDPDTFIRREGKERWEELLESIPSGLDFILDRGLELHGRDTEGRLRTVEEAMGLVDAVDDAVRKSLLISRIAQKTGVREESLWERVTRSGRPINVTKVKNNNKLSVNRDAEVSPPNLNSAEAKVLGFILAHPVFMEEFVDFSLEMWIESSQLRRLWDAMVNLYSQTGRLELSTLASSLETMPELRSLAMKLSGAFPPGDNPQQLCEEFKKFCVHRKKKALRLHVLENLRAGEENQDTETLLKKFQQLL